MFKHILVPVDGSELAKSAVRAAIGFARLCGARLSFYHARPTYFPGYLGAEMVVADPRVDEAFMTAMRQRADTLLGEARGLAEEAGVPCATRCTETDLPYRGIIEAAEAGGCDLIFMASHGRRGIGALLLGSETQKVLTHCKMPVLVYR